MLRLQCTVDTKAIEWAAREYPRQIPFALAYALTLTAKDAQRKLIENLRRHFTIRTPRIEKGIRIQMTKKGADPVINIGSKDWFMELQAVGGERGPKNQKHVAVPVGARANKGTITRQSRWPGKLDDPGQFPGKKGGGAAFTGEVFTGWVKTKAGFQLGTWKRIERQVNSAGDTKTGVQLLYLLKDKVIYKKRWPLQETVQETVRERWPANAIKAVSHALATRKPGR